jgi:chromosome segregation ATPase
MTVRRAPAGSLIDELQRREAAARADAEELRVQIADLAERLAGVKERLPRLVIARETVDEVLREAGSQASSAAVPGGMVRSRRPG